MCKTKLFKKLLRRKNLAATTAFICAAVLGLVLVANSLASMHAINAESETGSTSGMAMKIADASASGGFKVRFGSACTMPFTGENAKIGFDFFVSKGFTTKQSAGIIGNLMQESRMDPRASQRGGPGRGIAQWSLNERWATLLKWAGSRDEYALQTQLDFIIYELTTTEKATVPAVKATTTVHDATYQFEIKFERAGTPNFPARYQYADEAFAKYAATAPPVGCGGDITKGAAPNAMQDADNQTSDAADNGGAGLVNRGLLSEQVEEIKKQLISFSTSLNGQSIPQTDISFIEVQHYVDVSSAGDTIHSYSFDVKIKEATYPAKLTFENGGIRLYLYDSPITDRLLYDSGI